MRKPEKPRRIRSTAQDNGPQDETASFDIAAISLAAWLFLLVGVKFVEMMPSVPIAPPGTDFWAMASVGF